MNRVPDYLILRQCVEQWGVTERQAKTYKARAYKIWHDANEATLEQERMMSIDRLKTEQRNMKTEYKGTPAGMRANLAIEREINRLRGAYVPKVSIVKSKDDDTQIIKVADDPAKDAAREKRIAFLIAKAQQP